VRRLFAWWYLLIACGFVLLGVNRLVVRDAFWAAAIRFLIAAGFFTLAWFEFRYRGRLRR
jgi:hypothetical protein